jgi:nucleotide-binding universal stress UspA family protein
MPQIKNILLPMDFSTPGALAARHAGAFARRFQARLTLLHVNPVFVPTAAEPAGPVDLGWVTALEARSRQKLCACGREEWSGIEVRRAVVTGDPADKIVEYARQDQTDLIMMPTHGYGPFRRFLIGSVTAKVLSDAECPVWTGAHLEEGGLEQPGTIQNVVCAIDNGPTSDKVLKWAWSFAAECGAQLICVHAVPTIELAEGFLDPEIRHNRILAAEATVRCFQAKAGARGPIFVAEGEPAKVVAEAAADFRAEAVVIGRSPAHRARLRTQAYSIIRESPSPVISV